MQLNLPYFGVIQLTLNDFLCFPSYSSFAITASSWGPRVAFTGPRHSLTRTWYPSTRKQTKPFPITSPTGQSQPCSLWKRRVAKTVTITALAKPFPQRQKRLNTVIEICSNNNNNNTNIHTHILLIQTHTRKTTTTTTSTTNFKTHYTVFVWITKNTSPPFFLLSNVEYVSLWFAVESYHFFIYFYHK